MTGQRYYEQYHSANVGTADKVLLVSMLYERALMLAKNTGDQIVTKNMSGKAESISKLLAIISELMDSLDFEKGGQISINYNELYRFMFQQLIQINRNNDLKPLRVVVKILTDMKEGWDHVVKVHRSAQEQPVAPKQNRFHVVVR